MSWAQASILLGVTIEPDALVVRLDDRPDDPLHPVVRLALKGVADLDSAVALLAPYVGAAASQGFGDQLEEPSVFSLDLGTIEIPVPCSSVVETREPYTPADIALRCRYLSNTVMRLESEYLAASVAHRNLLAQLQSHLAHAADNAAPKAAFFAARQDGRSEANELEARLLTDLQALLLRLEHENAG